MFVHPFFARRKLDRRVGEGRDEDRFPSDIVQKCAPDNGLAVGWSRRKKRETRGKKKWPSGIQKRYIKAAGESSGLPGKVAFISRASALIGLRGTE